MKTKIKNIIGKAFPVFHFWGDKEWTTQELTITEATEKVLKEITDPFDNFKVTEPPDLQGTDVRKAWIAGQMSILIQIKQLIDKMTGLKE